MNQAIKRRTLAAAVVIFLIIGAFFMANVTLPSWSHYVSAINVILFSLPALWALKLWLGVRDALLLSVALGIFALAIESFASATGFPYGEFAYSDSLGFKLFGLVPWTVALAWTPLILAGYAIARLCSANFVARVAAAAAIATAFDIVIDPGAVLLGFWHYADGGAFYGVPLSNFGGWFLSGCAGAAIIEAAVRRFRPLLPTPVQLVSSSIFILIFWTALDTFSGIYVPAIVGSLLVGMLCVFYFRFHYFFDDMIVFVDETGQAIGTGPKLASHTSDTQLHAAFSVFLFNDKGEVLLQQRSAAKKTWPGVWSNSCCGHVMLHEKPADAAARRLRYELGISHTQLRTALPDFKYRAELDGIVENELCPVLIGFTNDDPQPNPNEVGAVKWVDWNGFLATAASPDSGISPWAVEEVRLLSLSSAFIEEFAKKTASVTATETAAVWK
ncbi:MAG: isopentenyl-diphosphate Delta-isomerase [Pyrinomonadaceae bacterium]